MGRGHFWRKGRSSCVGHRFGLVLLSFRLDTVNIFTGKYNACLIGTSPDPTRPSSFYLIDEIVGIIICTCLIVSPTKELSRVERGVDEARGSRPGLRRMASDRRHSPRGQRRHVPMRSLSGRSC